jgi:chorismate dehydratase
VESVLLVSRRPPEELDDRLVGLSRHSLTSVYLVKLLLEKAYHVQPRYAEDDRVGEAEDRLVIGDEALRLGPRFPWRGSGARWYASPLPFVF